jgi:deoxyribonuclease V
MNPRIIACTKPRSLFRLEIPMADPASLAQAPWQISRDELMAIQDQLGKANPEPWQQNARTQTAAGCFICYPKKREGSGTAGDLGWAAAALLRGGHLAAVEIFCGTASEAYKPGLLALREGPFLEAVLLRLSERPDVLIVNATGRDHPRRAGLALHLGARLQLPSVGVTRNPLLAEGVWPADNRGAHTPLRIGQETVGYWLRTKGGTTPIAVHAAWRTSPELAVEVVMALTGRWRTPEPLRQARCAARIARAAASTNMPAHD